MPDLIPVEHDPFAYIEPPPQGFVPPQFVPVDHDPFAIDPVTPPPATGILPAVGGYLRDVLSGKIAADALPNTYDPNKSFSENVRDPAGIAQAMGIAGGFSGAGLGVKAFHGSPYDFDAFDMSKIGTGEGAQVYGHGLYFAEHEPIARGYRDRLTTPPEPLRFEYKGENVYDPLSRSSLPDDIYNGSMELHARSSWTRPEAMTPEYWDRVKGELQTTIGNYEKAHSEGRTLLGDSMASEQRNLGFARAALNALNDPEFKIIPAKPSPGKIYEAEINADPEHFLDWDKPLNQQSAHVRAVLQAGKWAGPAADDTGAEFIRGLRPEDQLQLGKEGIPGIRYLDQGSRGAGEGTHNYVVFDDKLINIIRKYGVAGLIAGGAVTLPGQSNAGNTHLIPVDNDPFAGAQP